MYQLVKDLSPSATTTMVAGVTLPTPSVVEDADGIRALLAEYAGDVPRHVWHHAHALGAAYLVAPDPSGWAVALTEDFMGGYTEDHLAGLYRYSGWTVVTEIQPPTFREIVLSKDQQEQRVTGEGEVTGFVHLHAHSEYSALDGFAKISEMIEVVTADGQQALAATDHANVAAHPDLAKQCQEAGIKPIFGMEANLVEDRHRRGRSWYVTIDDDGNEWEVDPEGYDARERAKLVRRSDAQEVLAGYQHITLWAMDDAGLRNLWAMSTEAHREGFYGRARLDYDTLARLGEGVIASTGCLRGPLAVPLKDDDLATARHNMARLMEIFPDRLYVEIHTNHLAEQIKVNHEAVGLARDLGVPMVAAVDSHYAKPEDKEPHRAWLALQSDKDISEETSLFAGGQDYHLKTEAEVRAALDYLPADVVEEAVANTAVVANRCNAHLTGSDETPTFSNATKDHPDPVRWDVERLIDLCLSNWDRKITPAIQRGHYTLEQAEARFEREMALLIDKAFCGYFLVVSDYVRWAKGQGCLVGPGRGSGGGSQVAYLADITELDPLKEDLIFERFLTEGRTSLPDFDVDFPASWRERLKAYIRERWGEDYTLSIGTITRVQPKGAFNDVERVLKPVLEAEVAWSDKQEFKAAVVEADKAAAGTEVDWDTFVAHYEDLIERLRERYPEVMELVERFMGRVRSYGKHPAGMVVSTTAPLTDLPMRVDDKGNMISQFDMNALEELGYVKFDLLTLRTLDTIQQTVDLVQQRHGLRINVYDWDEEYEDPQVWEQVSDGNTLGIFQIETKAGTRLTRRYRPSSIQGLAAVMTLVRPGPKRSGLTETYMLRREGAETVSYPDPRLEQALGETYGAPIFQEQVMAITMLLAGYDSTKADAVRKILGKKQVEKVEAAGREFIAAAVENGMAQDAAEHLWAQLAEFAKYGFGKAHAVGYSVLGHWTAWLKFHFPVQFLTAALSTVDSSRVPEFVTEARRMGYLIGGPDVNESGVHFTPTDLKVRYGLASVSGIGPPSAAHIVANQPYTSLADFRERAMAKGSPVNAGHLAALVKVGAFDSLVPNRRAVELQLEAETSGAASTCVFKDETALGPRGLPCTFDWANEKDPPMVARGRGKAKVYVAKEPPKKCTRACRNFTPPPPIEADSVEPYTEADIRDREKEMLGVWLSSTPFDRLDPADLEEFYTTEEIEHGPVGAEYIAVAVIERVNEKVDRNNNRYCWVTLNAQSGPLDAICFASTYPSVKPFLRQDDLVFVVLNKSDRGLQVTEVIPPSAVPATP